MGMAMNCGKEGVKRNRLRKRAREGDITQLQTRLVGKEGKGEEERENETTLHYFTLHYNRPSATRKKKPL